MRRRASPVDAPADAVRGLQARRRSSARLPDVFRPDVPVHNVSDDVYELVATEVARGKRAARNISPEEVEQVPRDEHRIVSNPS
jgi:hypothetical protein